MRRRVLVACDPPLLSEVLTDLLRSRDEVELVSDDEIPGVIIATPPDPHWGPRVRTAIAGGARLVLLEPGGSVADLLTRALAN